MHSRPESRRQRHNRQARMEQLGFLEEGESYLPKDDEEEAGHAMVLERKKLAARGGNPFLGGAGAEQRDKVGGNESKKRERHGRS
ncbi:Protein-export membrane protein SecF [Sesbania bispinosa]|nr:Protein-export membrane protein SecF [Sesbania bispinosa]